MITIAHLDAHLEHTYSVSGGRKTDNYVFPIAAIHGLDPHVVYQERLTPLKDVVAHLNQQQDDSRVKVGIARAK